MVVLVDEYGKPILDNIDDAPLALQLRESLKDIDSVIKDSDAHIRFAMLTGVSKFSKVSLFSGLNNLTDITLDAGYSAICGYTDMSVLFAGQVFLFEFKVVELAPQGRALQQIKTMCYAVKYQGRGEPIHLIGVEFSKASGNTLGFEVETI